MAEPTTRPTNAGVTSFIRGIRDHRQRGDCAALCAIFRRATGTDAKMWGDRIVGFGTHRFRSANGREGDWFVAGFSPRNRDLTLYLMGGVERHSEQLKRLRKHRMGKCCLYIKYLADVDMDVLRELVSRSMRDSRDSDRPRRDRRA